MGVTARDHKIELPIPWTDCWDKEHETVTGNPVAFHSMRGLAAHSNGFHTIRALAILIPLLGTILAAVIIAIFGAARKQLHSRVSLGLNRLGCSFSDVPGLRWLVPALLDAPCTRRHRSRGWRAGQRRNTLAPGGTARGLRRRR